MIMDEATERKIFAAMKGVTMVHDLEDEHVVISAGGIGRGILRGNTIHLTQPLTKSFCTCLSISRDPLCVYHGDVDKVLATNPPIK